MGIDYKALSLFLLGATSFGVASACGAEASADADEQAYEEAAEADRDWDVWSSERKTDFLRRQLEAAMEDMAAGESADMWGRAEVRGTTALALLRVELWGAQRELFSSLEAEFEQVTDDTRPN